MLIVEDQMDVIDLMISVVDRQKWDLVVVQDFKEAAQTLVLFKYDVVVTDFQFPGGNGNMIGELAGKVGVGYIYLHTGDVENNEIDKTLYNEVFPKFSKDLMGILKGQSA